MGKIIKSVGINSEVDSIIENYIDNFSEFVSDCVMKRFGSVEGLDKEIEESENKTKMLKDLKKELEERKK